MALPPTTSTPNLAQTHEQLKIESGDDSGAGKVAADTSGKLPLNAQMSGQTKVVFHQSANLLSLSLMEQIDKKCAQSSCMGSTNPKNWTEAWVRDMGQNYLNVPHDTGKALGFVNRASSGGVAKDDALGLLEANRAVADLKKPGDPVQGVKGFLAEDQIQNARTTFGAKEGVGDTTATKTSQKTEAAASDAQKAQKLRATLDQLSESLDDLFDDVELADPDFDQLDIEVADAIKTVKEMLESVDGLINASAGELEEVGVDLEKLAKSLAARKKALLESNHADEAAKLKLDAAGNLINQAKNEVIKLDANNEEMGEPEV